MNDFDFLAGARDVANRWRTDFLDDSSEWEEFQRNSRESPRRPGGVNRAFSTDHGQTWITN
jgi:hypothetical protein